MTTTTRSVFNCGTSYAILGVTCLLLLLNAIVHIDGFNLENRLPIVKYGEEGTYFGYSVASHVSGEKDDPYNKKWLLVGAPLGQNLQPHTNKSGALFKCPLTQNNNDCEQVITDGRRLPGGAYEPFVDDEDVDDLMEPLENQEIKNGQWLGVTVRSQGIAGKVLVCAHRYISQVGESQHGQGLCYVLSNDLKYDETYEPCKGRSTTRAHEDYGFCQVGTSGTILEDNTMVLGTPGPYTWRGTVFVISVGGEYLKRDKIHYYGPHLDQTSPVDKYSYLGMAVTGGRYFGNHMSYASGAPRSLGHGQVVIFSKGISSTSNPMAVTMIIDGEQFASNFGYELTTADVNGDNLPDLIVAAPFYFSRHEGGAVYIYQNENHNLPKTATLKLTGKLESRFGLALTNLGDLNKDSCDDIAVGAPYEDNGVVYIYLGSKNGLIVKPSQIISATDLGLLSTPITTFGSSLSGGIDLDNNSYPDLLIGAYGSSVAVALLARPITNIKTEVQSTELRNIDPTSEGCRSDPETNLTCFSIKACCSIEPYESVPTKTLYLIYTIEAETYNNKKKFSRVFFGPDFEKRPNIVKRRIQVLTNGIMDCHEEVIYVKDNTRDIQSAINFRLNYTIVESSLPSSALIGLNPILDQTQADREFQASFQKDCGTDDVCQSQLELYADLELDREGDEYSLVLGEVDELHLNVTVVNEEDSAYEAQLFVEHQSSVTYIAASKGSTICNRFNNTIVSCTLGNPLRRGSSAQVMLRFDPSALLDTEQKLSFNLFANSTSKQIVPREKTVLAVSVVKRAEISIKGWAMPEQSFYGGDIKAESAIEYLDDIGKPVQHTYQIYNDGPWRVPYLDIQIQWPVQVASDGDATKWLLYLEEKPIIEGVGGDCSADSLSFVNPLNLRRKPVILDVLGTEPTSEYSRDSLSPTTNKSYTVFAESSEKTTSTKHSIGSQLNRVRRKRNMPVKAERLVDSDGKKTDIVHMDCTKKTAKCISLTCHIYNMQRKTEAYIHIKARLWNATLVSDYPRVDAVNIVSHAAFTNTYGIQQELHDDWASVETRAYPELLDQVGDGSIPIWIIIIAIIGGLLLLALFTYCLWRFGFFKRRRPDPTLSGNLEKNHESKLLLQNKK